MWVPGSVFGQLNVWIYINSFVLKQNIAPHSVHRLSLNRHVRFENDPSVGLSNFQTHPLAHIFVVSRIIEVFVCVFPRAQNI